MIFALDGEAPEWASIILFLVLVTILVGIAQFANTYADRDEDQIFVPSSPLLTGELDVGTAKKAFIWQNIVGGLLLIALLVITLNYWLIIALVVGWAVALTYSLPPFRFKERVVGPFFFAVGQGLKPIVAWLVVEPSLTEKNGFIIAFAVFVFVVGFASQISMTKLRKTFDALRSGVIQIEEGSSVYNIRTSGLKLKVKTAVALEAIVGLGAFILIPIFWYLGIFDMPLSVALLTLPLAFMILTVVFRAKDPVGNTRKCERFAGMAWAFISLVFFAVALASVIHWAFAILLSIVFLIGFRLLLRYVHPFGVAYRPL
jgi:4-hydroxybenzoate polyprenyltransferase